MYKLSVNCKNRMSNLNNLEIMCELSNFYMKYMKENLGYIPEKPPPMLSKEQHDMLLKYYSRCGKRL